MAANFIDEFSFDHPENTGFGKSQRLKLLTSKDPQFSNREPRNFLFYFLQR